MLGDHQVKDLHVAPCLRGALASGAHQPVTTGKLHPLPMTIRDLAKVEMVSSLGVKGCQSYCSCDTEVLLLISPAQLVSISGIQRSEEPGDPCARPQDEVLKTKRQGPQKLRMQTYWVLACVFGCVCAWMVVVKSHGPVCVARLSSRYHLGLGFVFCLST